MPCPVSLRSVPRSIGDNIRIDKTDEPLQSTYGWLRPVRVTGGNINHTFIYPRSGTDPSADKLRESFHLADDGFDSAICSVHGSIYIGRTSAGGEGQSIDIDRDGISDVSFDLPCHFILQLREGRVVAIEADRKVNATVGERRYSLAAYVPVTIDR